jgi:hypothetical protein
VAGNRPGARQLDLLEAADAGLGILGRGQRIVLSAVGVEDVALAGGVDGAALEAVGEVDDLVDIRLVLDVDVGALELRFLRIPLQPDVGVPVLEGVDRELGDEVGARARSAALRRAIPPSGSRSSRSARASRRETAVPSWPSSRRLVTPSRSGRHRSAVVAT